MDGTNAINLDLFFEVFTMKKDLLPDHETLRDLAENSPEKLEHILRVNIAAILDKASESQRRRLQGLQFQIDAQRKLAKNPVDACVRISRMMHDSFIKLNTALNNFNKRKQIDCVQDNDFCDQDKDYCVVNLADRK